MDEAANNSLTFMELGGPTTNANVANNGLEEGSSASLFHFHQIHHHNQINYLNYNAHHQMLHHNLECKFKDVSFNDVPQQHQKGNNNISGSPQADDESSLLAVETAS